MSKPREEKGIQIPDSEIKELLTDSELRMVKQRFAIRNLLQEGLSIRAIAKEVGVGTDTVMRTARMLNLNNQTRKRSVSPSSKTSKWVFGQVED